MAKIYLDTSVISALFDERTPERKQQTSEAWELLSEHDVYLSETVVFEINHATENLKAQMLDAVTNYTVLPANEKASLLADEYVAQGIFPEKYRDDAMHVAIASTNGIGILLSWNFTHLVKIKTRRMVSLVNAKESYPAVEIISPPEL